MGDKTIPDEAPPSLESFYPHESQVSIYHNKGVVDSLSRSPINTNKGEFEGTSAFRRLSHRRHPNKEVALNCMRRYGDTVTVIYDAK